MDQFIDIFKMNAKNPSRTRQMLMQRHAFITELVLKGGFVLYAMAGLFYFIEPIYAFVYYNEFIPLVPVFFPYIDENTTVGYVILTLIHIIYIALATIASACTDFMFIMIIANIPVLSNIFKDEVKELNETLSEEDADIRVVRGRLRNILLMHRELWEFVFSINDFYICRWIFSFSYHLNAFSV